MIILCEVSFHGRAHVPFNAGLLATIREAFPKQGLSFWGAPTHNEELKKQLGQALAEYVLWEDIRPPDPGTAYLKRLLREVSIISRLLKRLTKDGSPRAILTSAYPSTVLALKLVRFFRFRCVPVQIILHGVSGVVGKRYRRPIRRLQDTRTALTLLGNNRIQYIVLEKSIRDTLVQSLPFLANKVELFEHPVSPNEGAMQTIDFVEPMRFGFLGLADVPKGFPAFNELANHIAKKYGSRAEFHAIGHLPAVGEPILISEALATKPGTTLMSREEFLTAVERLHFIVLSHEARSYELTASGVLLDAIAWEKPVIARKIPIFEAMFERHGDMGYLFGNDTELKNIVEQILIAKDKSRYNRQVLNLRDARKSRAPEALAACLLEMFGRMNVGG
jgi:hypothetical protein